MRDRCDRLIGHAGECGSATKAHVADAPGAPEGYEIVDRDEYVNHRGDTTVEILVDSARNFPPHWIKRPAPWEPLDPRCTYARPIRKPAPLSPWVRASERQPTDWRNRPVRSCGGKQWEVCWGQPPYCDSIEWLDLDAVDRLAAENAELRERLADVADCGQDNAAEALKWRGRCADAERIAYQFVRTNAVLLNRIADMERDNDKLIDCARETNELLADAQAVAERAEGAARDAADRLAAYASPSASDQD